MESNSGQSLEDRSLTYSPAPLKSRNANRHIPLTEAYDLLDSQSELDSTKLRTAVDEGKIRVYDFKGESYVDRLDVGRAYHEPATSPQGISIDRYFSTEGEDPLQSAGEYVPRDLVITEMDGTEMFRMDGAMFPSSWDNDVANRIVAQKYFFKPDRPEWKAKLEERLGTSHENSPAHLITRVTNFYVDKGDELGYFATEADREAFRDDLMWLQINRCFAFNSPTQFNAGIHHEYGVEGNPSMGFLRDPKTGEVTAAEEGEYIHPQSHACFIKGPQDTLRSIAKHNVDEIAIFSAGSGIGQDIGALREEGAGLSGGGKSSGPMSFLKGYDMWGGTIKSGGKSRRAARMTTMEATHGDILDFVRSKVREDKKALALMRAGYEGGMDGEAFTTVSMQNTNISARLDDHFFEQAERGGNIDLISVRDGSVVGSESAERILQEIAFGTWRVGDPGVQYDSMIHKMHTGKNSGRQKSTNPCGEYMYLNDTSCNLASLNLLAFSDEQGNFDVDGFRRAARLVAVAQDIANDVSSYPVEEIARISPEFRTIGLGYANLGALLMRKGLAYDSDEGRAFAAGITALMTGTAYEASAELAGALEPFTHFEFNKDPMLEVIGTHKGSLEDVVWEYVPEDLREASHESWQGALDGGSQHGFRNAQVTVLAPTGTISYLMGCDTTGVEPGTSLIMGKDLAGGGRVTLVNGEIPNALRNLGYEPSEVEEIGDYIVSHNTVRGAPHLSPDHYPVFDTAFGNQNGEGSIPFEGHVRMVGAVQPFISGGISKTNNLPESATVKDVYDGFVLGHKLGLKGLTAFRTNSKPVSALNFGRTNYAAIGRGESEDLPLQREAFETEVRIGGKPFHMIVSEYADGRPGQVTFLSYKSGSTMGALLTTAGVQASKSLKRGVRLEDVADGWIGQEFEPHGLVAGHPHIKTANSPLDFAGKLLRLEYLGDTDLANDPENVDLETLRGARNGAFETYYRMSVDDWDFDQVMNDPVLGGFKQDTKGKKKISSQQAKKKSNNNERGVACSDCGKMMKQTAPNCYSCSNCGGKVGGCGQ